MGLSEEGTAIHWNGIKLRQHNGCCHLKIFICEKEIPFGHRGHRFRRNSGKYLTTLRLKCAPGKSLSRRLFIFIFIIFLFLGVTKAGRESHKRRRKEKLQEVTLSLKSLGWMLQRFYR